MKIAPTSLLLLMLLPAACAPDAPAPEVTHVPRLQLSSEPFALVIEFGTGGDPAGCDLEAGQRLEALVNATHPTPQRITTVMGLEGERDVCFQLTELSPAQRAHFVERAQREVGSGKNLTVRVDAPCRVFR